MKAFRLQEPGLLLLLVGCLLPLPSCQIIGPEKVGPSVSGFLTNSSLIQRVSKDEISAYGLPVDVDYAVDLYQLIYETPNPSGVATTASGLLAVPVGLSSAAPLFSYQHGTEVKKDAVASVGGLAVGETLVAVAYAAAGYLSAMPDYLGLGASPGLHPYVHQASLGGATVDMLRASREMAADLGVHLSGQVFLAGYSEGGSANMAAQRLIESEYADEFDLVASAPMAGPYDMSGIMVQLMKRTEPYGAPYYLPFLLLAYDQAYNLFDTPEDVFRPQFSGAIPGLYAGNLASGAIDEMLTPIPIELIREDYLAAFDASSEHPFRVALRLNDLYDWTPRTPTRLYHCEADELIPFANSELAFATMTARGAEDVSLAPLPFGSHGECAAPALLLAKLWFDSFLDASKAPHTRERRLLTPDSPELRDLPLVFGT